MVVAERNDNQIKEWAMTDASGELTTEHDE
jgi:hypothetical protein